LPGEKPISERQTARALDLAVAQTIGFIETGGNLLLHGERQFEHHRRYTIDEQIADCGVDPHSQNALAQRVTEGPASAHAYIVGCEKAAAPGVVTHIYAAQALDCRYWRARSLSASALAS